MTLRPWGQKETSELPVDAIVDARDHQEHDWSKIKSPLVQDLLRNGMVRRHETGFGIDAELDGAVIGADHITHSNLFAIGHPLRGYDLAERLAAALLERNDRAAEGTRYLAQAMPA